MNSVFKIRPSSFAESTESASESDSGWFFNGVFGAPDEWLRGPDRWRVNEVDALGTIDEDCDKRRPADGVAGSDIVGLPFGDASISVVWDAARSSRVTSISECVAERTRAPLCSCARLAGKGVLWAW